MTAISSRRASAWHHDPHYHHDPAMNTASSLARATPPALEIVNPHLRFSPVTLIDPSPSCFIHLAAEIDARPAFLPDSRRKRRLISRCKAGVRRLCSIPGVLEGAVFNAILVPPGRGEFLKRRPGHRAARYDLAILIECRDRAATMPVLAHPFFRELLRDVTDHATVVHQITASNVRRIGPVDHSRQGVFLFNYFVADNVAQNLAVWNYTAGWFQAETGLDNSTVLLPIDAAQSSHSIVNHCRWDSLGRILPSLIFKKTFRTYVLENFAANNVAAMPVLYRLE